MAFRMCTCNVRSVDCILWPANPRWLKGDTCSCIIQHLFNTQISVLSLMSFTKTNFLLQGVHCRYVDWEFSVRVLFENWMPRSFAFDQKWGRVRVWENFLQNTSVLDIIGSIILRKMTWVKRWRGEREKCTKVLGGNSERRKLFGRPRYVWEDNIK
jgi:hypothetical protein